MNVSEKLLYIQQNLKAPKSQYNKFGDFHYRSCEDIQEAVKPILKEVKAVLLIGDEIVQIGDRFYIKATAALQDTESPERITNTAFAREAEEKPKMDAAQVTGSCSSYARKYALNGLFCIDDAKDPDASQPAGNTKRQGTKCCKINETQLNKLCREAERTGTDLTKVCARYQVQNIRELNLEQYQRAMVAFSKMESVPPPTPDTQLELNLGESEMPFR